VWFEGLLAELKLELWIGDAAEEVFECITAAIAKFMPWEPPSWSKYVTRCEKREQDPEPMHA